LGTRPQLVLLEAPLLRHLCEKGELDASVELVDIYGVETILQAVVLCPEPRNGGFVFLLLIGRLSRRAVLIQRKTSSAKDKRPRPQLLYGGFK
jgi:hypothetical protein